MYKIAVMGDRDSIYGFASLGLEPFPLTDPAEAGKKVKDLAESGYAVIYITEAPVAYTHLDVYKRQGSERADDAGGRCRGRQGFGSIAEGCS